MIMQFFTPAGTITVDLDKITPEDVKKTHMTVDKLRELNKPSLADRVEALEHRLDAL